ncbi:hypothetical protein ACROYT_G010352 [Oculina patagonica]
MYGWFSTDDAHNKEWHSFLDHLGSSEFCIFGNQSFLANDTSTNSTNITGPTPVGFTTVNIPVLHLSVHPSDDFGAVVNNVTHVTAEMPATQLGLKGFQENFLVNITLSFLQPWFMDCDKTKCRSMYLEACGSVTVPTDIVPDHLLSRSTCNISAANNIVQMASIKKHARTVEQESKLCSTGIKAETSVPVKNQHTTTATMTMVDASAVNLRLQYSSYFLFVMVITCVLYGMIKGRPAKQSFNKKTNLPL